MNLPTTISSLEDAKAYFQSSGCSAFHMFRDEPELYRQYEALGVSKDLEEAWKLESIEKSLELLEQEDGDADLLWSVHSNVADLILNSRSVHLLERLLNATRQAARRASNFHRLIIAETVVGRQDIAYQPGFVFFALGCGLNQVAQEFALLARSLSATPLTPQDGAELALQEFRNELEDRRLKLVSNLEATIEACGLTLS